MTLSTPTVLLAATRARSFFIVLAVLLALAGGCAKRGPTQKEQARAQWNDARAQVLLNLGNEHYSHGNLADAREVVNDALRISNRVAGVYVLSAKLDIEEGNLQAASNALQVATALAPNDPEPFYLSGIIAERWQRGEEALAAYRTASEKSPSELAYLLAMAESLVGLDRATEAAEALEARLVYFESSGPIRDMLAQVYQQMGRHQEAAELFRQAAVLAPEDPGLRERHALALMQAQQWKAAADVLERLLERPEQAEQASLHMALAECRMHLGQVAMARAAFQRAARLEPRNHAAWLGLGKAALANDDLARVEYALGEAQALRPSGRAAADLALLQGYLRLKQQRPEEAAQSFSAASRHEPGDPMPLIMYGYCQQQLGNVKQAADYYNRALELDPTDALARELLSSLASAGVDLVH